jgi:hypothetical protein
MLWTPLEQQRQPRKHILLSFPELLTTRLRVVLPGAKPDQVWEVSELRVLNQSRELPRSPFWKIAAFPDPWEAPFAFDNNAVSKWSTERYGAHGAFLEIGFDHSTAVDSVLLVSPPDAPEEIGVSAELSPHGLIPLTTSIHTTMVAPPAGMRRAAIAMIKSYGFEYLIVSHSDYHADDFQKYAYFWGIRSAAQTGEWTLYHLE